MMQVKNGLIVVLVVVLSALFGSGQCGAGAGAGRFGLSDVPLLKSGRALRSEVDDFVAKYAPSLGTAAGEVPPLKLGGRSGWAGRSKEGDIAGSAAELAESIAKASGRDLVEDVKSTVQKLIPSGRSVAGDIAKPASQAAEAIANAAKGRVLQLEDLVDRIRKGRDIVGDVKDTVQKVIPSGRAGYRMRSAAGDIPKPASQAAEAIANAAKG